MKRRRMTTQLRRLISRGCIAMPGAFNAATARLIARAGFSAVYVSGAGICNATAGVPDIGLLGLSEVATLAGYITAAVNIPALVDADTGFGSGFNAGRTVRELERAGLAGMHLEDQVFPKRCGHLVGKSIVSVDEMTERLRAAAAARTDPDFLIVARTDARAHEGLDAAIDRAHAYLKAGADAIFPEALQTEAEFARFAKSVGAPLLANMTEFGKSPLLGVSRLGKLGFRMVIFPQTAFRVAMKAEESAMSELFRRGSQRSLLPRMQTRRELYELLDYDPSATLWPPKDKRK